MSDGKVKLYKNPDRSKPEQRKTYTPQYQVMGVEPEEYKSAIAPAGQLPVAATPQTADNPRTRRPGIRQPYAETTASPIGRGRGPVPNVGNNMEHTWSSVDGEIVDDISMDTAHPMIDNNEFVSAAALGLEEESHEELPTLDEVAHPPQKKFVSPPATTVMPDADDVLPILHNLAEGDYLLLVDGVAVCSGPVDEIQEQARLLVFGEHEMCDGNPIPVDDIVVIKRIPIKVGLFLE
jgi:hypothetical protein